MENPEIIGPRNKQNVFFAKQNHVRLTKARKTKQEILAVEEENGD